MISPIAFFQLAIANLKTNKLRAVLTMLGMVFGTGAVIATMSSSEGAANHIKDEMKKLGTNVITVSNDGTGPFFSVKHAELLKKYSTTIKAVSILEWLDGIEVRYDAKLSSVRALSAESEYFDIFSLNRKSGRIYDELEDQQAAPVVILGSAVKESLFGKENATGKFIHLYREKSAFLVQVIGVLEEKGGAQAEMVDRNIFLPHKTLSKMAASQPPNNTALAAVLKNEDEAPIARNEIKTLLKSQFPNGVQISDARETIERSKELWEKQNLVGLALALLSLLTGGVGIMNIMLLSIAQRSKEIGLRKAVGARDSHILIQFLLEAVILCLVGGVLGILFGVFFGQQVASLMGQWQATTSMMTIGVALAFSMMVGIGFGLLPAMRAARLDPYEALRT
jgi:putative ABC transport system permease protein